MNTQVDLAELRKLQWHLSQRWRRRLSVQWLRMRIVMYQRASYAIRRGWDICAVVAALLLGWPLWLLLAVAIRLGDGGPVLYWQWRVGYRGRRFRFPKFRSMVVNAESLQGTLCNQHRDARTFKQRADPRVTPLGRLMRRFSLDEIPQLWCVWMGDMTLVGPRPALPCEVQRYDLAARRRFEVLPGLTGLWQVSGRAELGFAQQLALDLEYIRQRSVRLDLWILLRTLPAVVGGRGAY